MFFKKHKPKIFICGIGGIGTSGLAILAKSLGYIVSGSNEEENLNTKHLVDLGINVRIGHQANNIDGFDLFVYSGAIDLSTNIEAIEAKARGIKMLERGHMLSILMKDYFNIVVAGSHGKTTTTGLIGNMLVKLNEKPNILIGGVLNDCGSNCVSGKRYFVVESDESDGSFLGMPTNIAVITNIDPEHMEFYKTKENLEYYFYRFAKKVIDNNGFVVICIDDEIGVEIFNKLKDKKSQIITYSAKQHDADFYYTNIRFEKNGIMFDVCNNLTNSTEKNVFLSNMFGEINASNSLATFAVGYILKKKSSEISKTLANFNGIQKRFTIVGKLNNTLIVDDYAHNPQKIAAAIGSCRHYMNCNNLTGRLTVVFEPHRYTRVRDGMDMFADSLSKADNVIVLPIYASSEPKIEGITQEFVIKKCKEKNSSVVGCELDVEQIKAKINEMNGFGEGNLIVFMGAGRSSKLAHQFVEG